MDGGGGLGDIPGQAAAKLLDADPLVQSWSGVSYSTLQLDGINVPVMGAHSGRPGGSPSPQRARPRRQAIRWCSAPPHCAAAQAARGHGRRPVAPTAPPVTLTVVGTATLPPIGVAGSSHLEMGTGALLSYRLIPRRGEEPLRGHAGPERDPGPHQGRSQRGGLALAPGHRAQAGHRGERRLVCWPCSGRRRSSTTDPSAPRRLLLGAALAAGAVSALGITLVTSVRRRRRDLAILKTLGFTRRQLAIAVAVQAGVAAVIGCAIGIPLGIALGRTLWDLFASADQCRPRPHGPHRDRGRHRADRGRPGRGRRHDPRAASQPVRRPRSSCAPNSATGGQSAKRPTSSSPTWRTVSGVPVGMLKMKYSTPAAASSSTRATSSSAVPMSEVVGSSPVTWRRKSLVDCRLLVARR